MLQNKQTNKPTTTTHMATDFFGRVKNKAGDMEKILKEKDKHGLWTENLT